MKRLLDVLLLPFTVWVLVWRRTIANFRRYPRAHVAVYVFGGAFMAYQWMYGEKFNRTSTVTDPVATTEQAQDTDRGRDWRPGVYRWKGVVDR